MRAPLAAVLVVALLTSAARAQPVGPPAPDPDMDASRPDDYVVGNRAWNGLSTLAALARGLGYRFVDAESLDWEDLDADDVLMILYPTDRVPPSHVAAFIRNGGRVLLADDFGNSHEAFARLGMLREEAIGVDAPGFYQDLAYAPIARPWLPDHPLARGVDRLTTNHPAVLTRVKGPEIVFGFGTGEGVVTAGTLGEGRFVTVSDGSVFINRMLQFPGNMRFATNAIRYLARDDQTRRIVVLTGDYILYGEPSRMLDDGTVRGTVAQIVSDMDNWLEERNDYLLTVEGLRFLSVAAALLVAILSLGLLPMARKSRLDGAWTHARGAGIVVDDFENVVSAYDHHGYRGNYLFPATVLRDGVNARLARLIGRDQPLFSLREGELEGQVEAAFGPRAATALRQVYRRLKGLPSRLQAASPWRSGFVSRREFERLHDDVHALYRTLEPDDPHA